MSWHRHFNAHRTVIPTPRISIEPLHLITTSNFTVVVLGEMQTHEQPSRKFIQTFVLAEQPSGFFVLNDVFRFLKEEYIGEAEYEAAVAAQQQGQQTGASGVSPVPQQQQQVPKQQQPQQQHAPHQEMSYGKHPLAPSTAAPVASAPAAAPKSPVKPPQSQAPVVAKPVVTAAESKPVANTTAATTTAPVPVASKPVAAVSAATAALAATRPTASPTPKTWASLVVDAAAKPSTSEQPAKPTAATTSAPAASVVPAASSTAAMRPPSGKSGHGLNVAKAVFIRGTRAAKIPLLKEEFGKSIGAVRWIDLMTEVSGPCCGCECCTFLRALTRHDARPFFFARPNTTLAHLIHRTRPHSNSWTSQA